MKQEYSFNQRRFPLLNLFFLSALALFYLAGCTKPEEPFESAPRPEPAQMTKFEIETLNFPLIIGDTRALSTVTAAGNRPEEEEPVLTWASENPTVATVNSRGLVTALSPGKAIITAFWNGQSASIEIKIQSSTPPGTEVRSSTTSLPAGEGLKPKIIDSDLEPTEVRPSMASLPAGEGLKPEIIPPALEPEESAEPVAPPKPDNRPSDPLIDLRPATAALPATPVASPPLEDQGNAIPTPAAGTGQAVEKAPQPKPITNNKIKVEVVDYSWESGFTWTNFNKTEASWVATVKNHNPEPRHICINYEFLDDDNLPVFQNGKCEVILGNSEGLIRNSIMVQSRLIQDVVKSNVVPLEAHRLHSFVRPPK